ncbi:inner membrane-spanning protein YciB [Caenispirillum salinarum]|uniref:inner membrane-spanning protein YciB n=1 Tax=Caenispirillum salinarum TaxID=859058 RepID=UPI00384A9588
MTDKHDSLANAATAAGHTKADGWDLRGNIRRMVLELGPALLLFVGTSIWDIYVGTALLIAGTLVSTVISWRGERRIPLVPVASLVSVGAIGGLTLVLTDPRFVKMEPTISNTAVAVVLAAALAFGRMPLRTVFGAGTRARPEAWKHLTLALVTFLLVLSGLNEVVWRSFDTDTWAAFKAFAIPALNIAFLAGAWTWLRRNAE